MLTATAGWPTRSRRLVLFVLRGVFVSLAVFGLLRLGWMESHAVLPFTLAEGALAIRLFGVPALPIDVTLACSGAEAMSLCLGAVLAYPAPWRKRVTGAAGAVGMILALNILRIGTLGRVSGSRVWFDALHLYVWPAAMTLAIAAYVFVWMRQANSALPAPAVDTPPRLSRRFVALTAFFLLAFVAAAPFYLNSPAVLVVAAFIAKTTAALLTVAGLHASAAANVLSAPHGSFIVTEECISTPLIPIYLAAVVAYSPNWRRLSLGLVLAAPLFVALGIVRLLVVALPQSLAAQSFFIHAFYQLLSGVAIVFGAAYWRHRNHSTFAWGVAGVGVGVLFVVFAGAVYLHLITLVTRVPLVDPQGAIGFLPVFQIALYLAIWTAAYIDASWKRFSAGLLLLVAAEITGLIALNALLDHSGLTIAVRDVRGLALAAPVLVFAAAVSLGRPRR